MARHRRYPTKKSVKNTTAQKIERLSLNDLALTPPPTPLDRKNRKLNKRPPDSMLDDQPVTWKEQMLKQMATEVVQQRNKMRKRSRKPKNRLLDKCITCSTVVPPPVFGEKETQKLGYQHMPWESAKTLIYRIQKEQNKSINDELLKARFGKAGRDIKEIAQEYKMMDERRNRVREQRKITRKEKQSKSEQNMKELEEVGSRNSEILEEDRDDQVGTDEKGERDEESATRKERGRERGENKRTDGTVQKEDGPKALAAKRKRLSKSVKVRSKRMRRQSQATKELILNAREVIPFGERADAPPAFSSELARTIRSFHERTGKKELLLERFLRFDDGKNKALDWL